MPLVFLRQREGSMSAPLWPHGFQHYPKVLKNDSIRNICTDEPAGLGKWMLIDSTSFSKLNFFSKGELPSMGIPVMYKEVSHALCGVEFLEF